MSSARNACGAQCVPGSSGVSSASSSPSLRPLRLNQQRRASSSSLFGVAPEPDIISHRGKSEAGMQVHEVALRRRDIKVARRIALARHQRHRRASLRRHLRRTCTRSKQTCSISTRGCSGGASRARCQGPVRGAARWVGRREHEVAGLKKQRGSPELGRALPMRTRTLK